MTSPRSDPASFLSPSDRLWLDRTCQRLGVPPRTWSRVEALRRIVEIVAVETLADRLQAEQEYGRRAALMDACSHVGVPFETHRSRRARARRDAFLHKRNEKGRS